MIIKKYKTKYQNVKNKLKLKKNYNGSLNDILDKSLYITIINL